MSDEVSMARASSLHPTGRVPGTLRRKLPFTLSRSDAAGRLSLPLRLASLILGLGVGGLIIAATTPAGLDSFSIVWTGTFGSILGVNQLIELIGPLMIAGCSAAIAARAGLWNIGIDGQLILGAWVGTGIAFLLPNLDGALLIPLILLGAMAGGAIAILLPALARAYWNVDEIVSTLLLNFVAAAWVTYWVTGPWRESSSSTGTAIGARPVTENATTPNLALGDFVLEFAVIVGLVLAVALWLIFRYSAFGFRVRLVGADPRAARYAGVNVARTQVGVMLLSGAVGGLTGIVVELGGIGRFGPGISNYTGYIGLLVAGLAGAAFLECVPMAALVGLIAATGASLQIAGVPGDIVFLLSGVVFLFGALIDVAARYRLRRRTPEPNPARPQHPLAPEAGR